MRTIGNVGLNLIKHYESKHDGDLKVIGLQPKQDPIGIWTIGYGHALTDPVTRKMVKGLEGKQRAYELAGTITDAQADAYLEKDTQAFATALDLLITGKSIKLTDAQFDALMSFCYNLGMRTFEKSSLYKKLCNGDFNITENFLKYVLAGGEIMGGLVARRMAEAHLFSTGTLMFYKWDKNLKKAVADV